MESAGYFTRMMRSASEAGLWIITRQKSLQLLAVCYVFGGGNEDFVCDERVRESMLFAARMIGVGGGSYPSHEDADELKRLISECGDFNHPVAPAWAMELAKEYNFSLR